MRHYFHFMLYLVQCTTQQLLLVFALVGACYASTQNSSVSSNRMLYHHYEMCRLSKTKIYSSVLLQIYLRVVENVPSGIPGTRYPGTWYTFFLTSFRFCSTLRHRINAIKCERFVICFLRERPDAKNEYESYETTYIRDVRRQTRRKTRKYLRFWHLGRAMSPRAEK